tara:strand:- start:440 stop:1015 length:576 start_codon:yes stop_codon:yes gene_type:complete
MSFLFTTDDDNIENINIDELYEKQQQRDLRQLSIFNKILNRIHHRIKLTSRTKKREKHVWFQIPEFIFGEPVYKKDDCIGYIVSKLEQNKFHVKYIHPNTLFISWSNWVPSYVRNEFKKKTGMIVNEFGQVIETMEEQEEKEENLNQKLFNTGEPIETKEKKEYNNVKDYKPTGNFIYRPEYFDKIEKKMN